MTYEECIELNKRVLDSIDIAPYLKKGGDMREVMRQLKESFPKERIPKDMYEDLFCFFTPWDFMDYLERRYNIKIYTWEESHFEFI